MFKTALPLITCALISSGSTVFADTSGNNSGNASEYHFKATLTEGSSSLRSTQLTWPVISKLLQEDLRDLQIYNADQQAVPFTIRSVTPDKQTQKQTRALNFFPMGDIEKLGTILKQEANGQRYKTVKLTQTGQQYLIIDNQMLESEKNPLPLQALKLEWTDLEHWLPKSLRIESSNDLTTWQSLAIEKLPYRMAENGVTLENHELKFKQSVQKRFIRLSGAEDFEPLLKSLKTVTGYYQRTSVSRPLNWNNVDLKTTDDSRQFLYEIPPSLDVERWELKGLSTGSLYKGRLNTRSTERFGNKPNEWRYSQNFMQYSMQTDAGLVTSEPNSAPNRSQPQEWRIDFQQDITGDALPKLALAWRPLELVFVAQGKEPFEIRFGSRTSQANARMQLDQLLKATTPEVVEISSVAQLSEVAEKDTGSSYKYLLWGLLAAAFLMLLYMAKGLLKEMNSAD